MCPEKEVNTYTIDNQEVDVVYTVFYRVPAEAPPAATDVTAPSRRCGRGRITKVRVSQHPKELRTR
jgi:hypothetical protein